MDIILAEREAQLMQLLWELGPSTVADVQAALEDHLAYTSVLSQLRALESKGYVGHTEEGRAHRYHALIERTDVQRSALGTLLARLFKGSTDELLLHMVSEDKLSVKHLRLIEGQLRKRKKRRSP